MSHLEITTELQEILSKIAIPGYCDHTRRPLFYDEGKHKGKGGWAMQKATIENLRKSAADYFQIAPVESQRVSLLDIVTTLAASSSEFPPLIDGKPPEGYTPPEVCSIFPLSAAVQGSLNQDTWRAQQLFMLDFDGNEKENPPDPNELAVMADERGCPPFMGYYTKSAREGYPAARLAWLLPEPVTDPKKRDEIWERLYYLTGSQADHGTNNKERYFDGCGAMGFFLQPSLVYTTYDDIVSATPDWMDEEEFTKTIADIDRTTKGDWQNFSRWDDDDLLAGLKYYAEAKKPSTPQWQCISLLLKDAGKSEALWDEWSRCVPGYNEQDNKRQFNPWNPRCYKRQKGREDPDRAANRLEAMCLAAGYKPAKNYRKPSAGTGSAAIPGENRPAETGQQGTDPVNEALNKKPRNLLIGAYRLSELTQEDSKSIPFIVEGLVPEGVTLLAAPPKMRKSFFCLQLACAVAEGKDFLGKHTTQGEVLYIDLEGKRNRTGNRLKGKIGSLPAGVYMQHTATDEKGCPLSIAAKDLLAAMQETISGTPSIKLVIIDTMDNVKGSLPYNGRNAQELDKQILLPFTEGITKMGISVILVHHTRKATLLDGQQETDIIAGSSGIIACMDNVIQLIGKREDPKTRLLTTCRDASSEDFYICFDETSLEWNYAGEGESTRKERGKLDNEQEAILSALRLAAPKGVGEEFKISTADFCKEYLLMTDDKKDIATAGKRLRETLKIAAGDLYAEDGIIVTEKNTNKAKGIAIQRFPRW